MGHEHHEHHAGEISERPLYGAIALTGTIFLLELAGGWWTGSLALIADAAHMAVDLLGLSLALVAAVLSRLPADPKRTYGYRRVEVLAALGNAIALMVATGFLLREAWARFVFPTPIAAGPMIGIAIIGLLCNMASAAILWRASRTNINMRGAFLHVLSDGAGSVGAVLAGVIILQTRWYRADALVTVLICVGIVLTAFWLLRDSVHILLEGAPAHLDLDEIRAALASIPGVMEVHDLHLWSLTQGQEAMSGHLVLADGRDHSEALAAGKAVLAERFNITHVTLQIERNDAD
ncbi:MAG: cation transporter [Elusimicrobia bacterium CG11_big_fil_rev_8_21_14_0_20_64_6]|nr:MAG: cation transporter [Elusimicrobia bacterium CG11_big_fil_rev_8_21_14_0_20_64_6]